MKQKALLRGPLKYTYGHRGSSCDYHHNCRIITSVLNKGTILQVLGVCEQCELSNYIDIYSNNINLI
jgi:hypothetical protein